MARESHANPSMEDLPQRHPGSDLRSLVESGWRADRWTEHLLHLLIDTVQDYAIYLIDPDGTLLSWNRGAERMMGYAAGELIGRPHSILFTEPDQARGHPAEVLRHAMDAGRHTELGWRRRKDGSHFWARTVCTSLREPSGRIIALAEVTQDLSREHAREQALRASEQRFRFLFESNPAMYFTIGPDARIRDVNEYGAEYLGYTPDELKGRSLLEIIHEDDRGMTGAEIETCLRTPGSVHQLEFRKIRHDGSVLWVRDVARAVMSPSGELEIHITCADISEIRESEAALRESEARYRAVTDLIPHQIWIADPDGRLTFFSRRWYEYTGGTPEEAVGDGWLNFVHPDDREGILEQWQHALATGNPYMVEHRLRSASGEYRWFLLHAVPQRTDEGEIVRWFGSQTDIDAQHRLAAKRQRILELERAAKEEVEMILESISDAFVAVDHSWRFVHMNSRWKELVRTIRGDDVDSLIGKRFSDTFPEIWNSKFGEIHRRAMAERVPLEYEGYFSPWRRWYEVRDYPWMNGLAVFIHDITHRKAEERERQRLLDKAQRALEIAEQHAREERALREAVSALGQATSTKDGLRDVARAALDATGASGAIVAWIRKGTDEFVEVVATAGEVPRMPRYVSYDQSYTREAVEGGRPHLVSRLADWPAIQDERLRDFADWSVLVVPLTSRDRPLGTLFLLRRPGEPFSREMTSRATAFGELAALGFRRLEMMEEAQERSDELERITESRAHLMRGFSHDLKNPLGAADGHAQLLEEGILGELTERQRASVSRIRRSLRSGLRLIVDNLLDLAKVEAGQIELVREKADAARLAREVAEDFQAQAKAAGREITVTCPESLPIVTDTTRNRQVLGNLVSNALKYGRQGPITLTVGTRPGTDAIRAKRAVTMTVGDEGPGIPKEKQEQIFHEFVRLDTSAPHGSGVGLAISRHIARLLDGDITVDSEVGQGARFTIWLPAPDEDGEAEGG